MPNLIIKENLARNYILNGDELEFNEVIDLHEHLTFPDRARLFIYKKNDCVLKLIDAANHEMLSIMRLKKMETCGYNVFKVDKVKSLEERKGYGQFLYEFAMLHLEFPIMSDRIQTMPGSYDLWKKLHRLQDSAPYEILVLNESVASLREYNRTNIWTDYEIWGWDKTLIELLSLDAQCLIDGLANGEVSRELFHYIDSNPNKIVDRDHIKLIGRKKSTVANIV